MPEPPRLEADGLPSVDFAVRSPNVEETSSDDEGPSHGGRPDESLEAGDGGLGRYIDEIQLTELDGPTPNSPPAEKSRVPGSPSPLQEESGEGAPLGPEAGPARAPLHTMPSPVRGRRSLSPQPEAPVDAGRPNSYGQGSNTDLLDDSVMGASPRTEESMDCLASFFQEGNIQVPLRVPAEDELLEEPSQQERDCHSSQDGITRCCQHGVPCTAFYPSPEEPAGPGAVAGPHPSSRYANDTAAHVEVPSHPAEPPPQLADSRELRAGVPRIPAPTAHQTMAEVPSTRLSSGRLSPVNVRTYPAPSTAPMFAQPARTGDGPAPEAPQGSAHVAPFMADVSSRGAAPGAETVDVRPRQSGPLPEVFGPDSTTHSGSGLPNGMASAGPHSGLPPVGPQSAGPLPAEPEGAGHLRSEGQVLYGVPMHSGQRPQATFGNQMAAGLPPQSWGYAGPTPASQGSLNHGAYPYNAFQPAYGMGQRVPRYQQDLSGALPGPPPGSFGFSGVGPALSQGPIAQTMPPPMPPPVYAPSMAVPTVPPAAVPAAAPAQIPLPTHGSVGVPPQAPFPTASGPLQAGAVPVERTIAAEPTIAAMPREGVRTAGQMPDEPYAQEGQGRPTRSQSGIPPAPAAAAATPVATAAAPMATAAPMPTAAMTAPAVDVPPAEAALRTEAPVPEQAHPVQPALAHATPLSATQCSSQTEGPLPHIRSEEQHRSPDISQGQVLLDHGGDEARDPGHEMEGAESPSGLEAHSPFAPSGVPDLDGIDQASPQLETPPPTVQRMDQGQQTTPEKPRMPRRKRAQAEPIRLPKDGDFKLVQVDMDEVRSCNQAEGRPKRKQIRVLKGWQNERVVYERVPGSACPTVCKVMVAQPVLKDQKAIPLELNLGEDAAGQEISPLKDKTGSPLPSNNSDCTYSMLGPSEDEKFSMFEEDEPEMQPEERPEPRGSKRAKTGKARSSRLRKVEMAAEVGSAAAAAVFEAATPPRARPSHTANGFVRVPIAEGSTEACEIRVGLENASWMSCDINIPPRSFNTPEQLAENRSLLIYVMSCQDGTFDAQVDEDIVALATGSSMVIRPGQEYCLRNGSDQVVAQLKMTMINSSRS